MSQIEVLPAHCPIDFTLNRSSTHVDSFCYSENFNWTTKALVNDIISSSPSLLVGADPSSAEAGLDADNCLFPSLPPLLHGHPEVHLRAGIMNASRLAGDHEPDAEKAFFVADLSQVYRQHQRWKACLPEIQPFYGPFQVLSSFFVSASDTHAP